MRGEELLDHSKRARRDLSRLSYMLSLSSSSRIMLIFFWEYSYVPSSHLVPPLSDTIYWISRLDPVPSLPTFLT